MGRVTGNRLRGNRVFFRQFLFRRLTGNIPLFLSLICLASVSCSSHKEGSEIAHLPLYFSDKLVLIPGEQLNYKVNAGVFHLGNIRLKVMDKIEEQQGRPCAHIEAKAGTRSGISWLSNIQHSWDSWIDTSNGLTVKMHRKVQENKYHAEQELWFYPDSSKIVLRQLHKEGKPSRSYPAEPGRMNDLVNSLWKFRFTPFENQKAGDTLQYASFFDGEWLVLKVRFGGVKPMKRKGKRLDCYVLYPIGIQSRYLKGSEPSEIWIEKTSARRPLRIKVSTYFGNLSIDLQSEDHSSQIPR